jgi:hypothetical protein
MRDCYRSGDRWLLSGGDAYALRCSFVHEGSGEILEQRAREALTHISFHVPNKAGIVAHKFHLSSGRRKTLVLRVDTFCRDMIDAVTRWSDDVTSNQAVQQRLQSLLQIHSTRPL